MPGNRAGRERRCGGNIAITASGSHWEKEWAGVKGQIINIARGKKKKGEVNSFPLRYHEEEKEEKEGKKETASRGQRRKGGGGGERKVIHRKGAVGPGEEKKTEEFVEFRKRGKKKTKKRV